MRVPISYLPNCEASTILFCRLLQVPVTDSTLKHALEVHPDYPSLLAISDVLNDYSFLYPDGIKSQISQLTQISKMKKLKLDTLGLSVSELLNREQMKKIYAGCGGGCGGSGGGGCGATTSCSCTLKSSTGVTLTLPSSITNTWTTSTDCSNNCKTYCDGANSGGGDCKSYSSVWGSN